MNANARLLGYDTPSTPESPLISVVVPFYNLESYARDCLDSLIEQTFDSYEIVCIDDGSTDDTHNILDDYAAQYDFIRVFHLQNEGVSSSRNRGVKLSRGSLISFVDGDDLVSPYYLSTLYAAHQGVPNRLVQGKWKSGERGELKDFDWKDPLQTAKTETLSGDSLRIGYLLGKLSVMSYAKLADRSIYEAVPFSPMKVYEDITALPDIVENTKEAVVIDQVIYGYVTREGSLSRIKVVSENDLSLYLSARRHVAEVIDRWDDDIRRIAPWRLCYMSATIVGMASDLRNSKMARAATREAVSYLRKHLKELIAIRKHYSLGWENVMQCTLAALSPKLYALIRQARHNK